MIRVSQQLHKAIQSLSQFVCLNSTELTPHVSSPKSGNKLNNSYRVILRNTSVWSTLLSYLLLHLSKVSAPLSDCCYRASMCSLYEAPGSTQMAERNEQSHYWLYDDSFFTHFLGGIRFKTTPILKILHKTALWHRLPFLWALQNFADLNTGGFYTTGKGVKTASILQPRQYF